MRHKNAISNNDINGKEKPRSLDSLGFGVVGLVGLEPNCA